MTIFQLFKGRITFFVYKPSSVTLQNLSSVGDETNINKT